MKHVYFLTLPLAPPLREMPLPPEEKPPPPASREYPTNYTAEVRVGRLWGGGLGRAVGRWRFG